MKDWVKGLTYEATGQVDAHIVYPETVTDMARYTMYWTDTNPYSFITASGGGGSQDLYREYSISKVLTVADRFTHTTFPVHAKIVDKAFTSMEISDHDSGSICFEIGEVLEHNEPAMAIGNASAQEGDSGTVNLNFQVCLDEMALGEALSVNWSVAHGTTDANDILDTSGSLTFAVGEQCKTITVRAKGDTELEGTEFFYVNLYGNSHGTIANGQAIGTIIGDDALPCGADASSGGDGVEWFSMSTGSDVSVVTIAWDAFDLHDRWDVFANGIWVGGSNSEIDRELGLENPPYDKPTWDANGGGAQTNLTISSLANRTGSSLIFVPSYPAPFWGTDPLIYEIRTQGGGSGTAWDMGSVCEEGVWNAVGAGGASQTNDNSMGLCENRVVIYDMEANNSGDSTIRFDFNNGGGSTSNTLSVNGYDYGSASGLASYDVQLIVKRKNTVLTTVNVSANASASFSIPHSEGVDFRYISIEVRPTSGRNWTVSTGAASGQNEPKRTAWSIGSSRV